MIRHIVAIDSRRGMAKNGAMPPWKLKQDEAYFTAETQKYGGNVLMGKKTFIEALQNRPLENRTNYIVTHDQASIDGAEIVNDLKDFLHRWPADKDLWIIGGAEIFAETMHIANELYVTEIEGDFDCDQFYPHYRDEFEVIHVSEPYVEHEVRYRFCVYKPLSV